MRFFLTLLLVVLIAFGDAYKCMSLANDDDNDQFIGGGIFPAVEYAYMVAVGSFAFNFGKVAVLYVNILFVC